MLHPTTATDATSKPANHFFIATVLSAVLRESARSRPGRPAAD
jgi:hypothetical protein